MSETKALSQSALRFFSGTLLSRVSGLARDMTMAFCFGASAPLAAFFLAYRFIYLFRRLFGEGLLHQGFIPHFESVRKVDTKRGAAFYRDLFASLGLVAALLILFFELILVPFRGEVVHLSRLMFPGILFLILFAINTALLQAEKRFFLPSVSPVAFNLCWVLAALLLRAHPIDQAISSLALILTLAFLVQLAVTMPTTWRYLRSHLSVRECFRPKLFSSELSSLVRPMLLGLIGVAAVQVNSAVDALFARFASPEGPAYLWYASRLQQLPLALFGIALSSALLPTLSRAVKDQPRFDALLSHAIQRTFTLLFPCTLAIFVLGLPSVNLLFGRGDFTAHATLETAYCLFAYGIGLIPAALVLVLAPAFYAQKEYRIPATAFAASALFNILLNTLFVFVFHLGPMSIALATSFSAFFNLFYLARILKPPTGSVAPYIRVFLATLVASALAWGVQHFLGCSRDLSSQFVEFTLPCALFFATFLALLRPLKIKLI